MGAGPGSMELLSDCRCLTSREECMQRQVASRMRMKYGRGRANRVVDTTIFPIAMIVVLTVVLVLLMVLAAHR